MQPGAPRTAGEGGRRAAHPNYIPTTSQLHPNYIPTYIPTTSQLQKSKVLCFSVLKRKIYIYFLMPKHKNIMFL